AGDVGAVFLPVGGVEEGGVAGDEVEAVDVIDVAVAVVVPAGAAGGLGGVGPEGALQVRVIQLYPAVDHRDRDRRGSAGQDPRVQDADDGARGPALTEHRLALVGEPPLQGEARIGGTQPGRRGRGGGRWDA